MKKINVKKIRDDEKCLAIYADACLIFPDSKDKRKFNEPLSSLIENWAFSIIDKKFNIFLATLICNQKKSENRDLENLLFYNLNYKLPLNCLIAKSKRIIFQCFEDADSKYFKCFENAFEYIYFYSLFNQDYETLYKYLLCNFKVQSSIGPISIEVCDFLKLFLTPKDKCKRDKLLDNLYQKYYSQYCCIRKIPAEKKYALKITIPDILSRFICSVDYLKTFLDCIVIFLNKLNIIEKTKAGLLVTSNGCYNPTDTYLYFCEIEKVNSIDNPILVYLCMIESEDNKEKSCCNQKESLKNLMQFIM